MGILLNNLGATSRLCDQDGNVCIAKEEYLVREASMVVIYFYIGTASNQIHISNAPAIPVSECMAYFHKVMYAFHSGGCVVQSQDNTPCLEWP